MPRANYDDAIVIARILEMNVDTVWPIIRGMRYAYYSDLKVAVLNSPVRQKPPNVHARNIGSGNQRE